jgi:hypothetical protein
VEEGRSHLWSFGVLNLLISIGSPVKLPGNQLDCGGGGKARLIMYSLLLAMMILFGFIHVTVE